MKKPAKSMKSRGIIIECNSLVILHTVGKKPSSAWETIERRIYFTIYGGTYECIGLQTPEPFVVHSKIAKGLSKSIRNFEYEKLFLRELEFDVDPCRNFSSTSEWEGLSYATLR